MKNYKFNKIIITTLILIIAFTLIIGLTYIKNSKKQKQSSVDIQINNIYESILHRDNEELKDEEKQRLEDYVNHVIDSSEKANTISKGYFILGYVYGTTLDSISSIEMYNNAINYINDKTDPVFKIKLYYELSNSYLIVEDYNKSEIAFNEVISLSKESHLEEDLIEYSLLRANKLSQVSGGNNKAVSLLEEMLDIAKSIKYDKLEDVYLRLGISYWYLDKSIEAMSNKLEALAIVMDKKLEKKALEILIDIGVDYLYTDNYNEAINYLEKTLEYTLEDPYEDADIKAYALLNICQAYIFTEEYEKASYNIELLERYINKQKEGKIKEDTRTYMYANKAELEIKLNNPTEALYLLDIAKNRYETTKDFTYYDFDLKLIKEYGDAYYKLGEYNKALEYHKEAYELAEEREIKFLKDSHTNSIYLDYKAIGDLSNALLYLEKKDKINEQAKNDQNLQYSQYLLNKFQSEQNLEKIEALEKSRSKMRALYFVLLIITALILINSIFIYRKNMEIRRLNTLLKDLSETDELTNVANRRALEKYLDIHLESFINTNKPISVVMTDVDYFKKYNDNYGHIKGDEVLALVANTIKNSCRNTDFIARYGGEEFIIIMLNTDEKEVIKVIERINKNIYELNISHEFSEVSDRITISSGITTAYIKKDSEYNEYIKKADEALYLAKKRGRNRFIYLDS